MSPEGDDGRLSLQFLLLLREVDGEERGERLSRDGLGGPAENAEEDRREELDLDRIKPLFTQSWIWKSKETLKTFVSVQKTGGSSHLIKDAQRLQTLPEPAAGPKHTG